MFELFCLLIVGYRVVFFQKDGVLDYIVFFLIAAIVTIAFSEQSLMTFQISGKKASFLGKFSLALYLNSCCWSFMTARAWPDMSYKRATMIYLSLTFVAALTCMAVCGLFQNLWKKRLRDKVYVFLFEKLPRNGG